MMFLSAIAQRGERHFSHDDYHHYEFDGLDQADIPAGQSVDQPTDRSLRPAGWMDEPVYQSTSCFIKLYLNQHLHSSTSTLGQIYAPPTKKIWCVPRKIIYRDTIEIEKRHQNSHQHESLIAHKLFIGEGS